MAQEAIVKTVEASGPWLMPPLCTRPDALWCSERFLRSDAPGPVCRAKETCKELPPRAPAMWSEADEERLLKNSHLDISTLQRLLDSYYTADEIRAKLEEVDP